MSRLQPSKGAPKGLYVALAGCLVASAVVGYVVFWQPAQPTQSVAAPQNHVTAAPPEPVAPPEPIKEPEPEPQTAEPEQPQEPAEEDVRQVLQPQELMPMVVSPLDGTTVTVFSMTELLYDETMADWRTHDGLDIQAGEEDAVKTAASGTVVSVAKDELMGVTVVIDHGDGYTTQYSSLQEDPPVSAGQNVSAGEVIGCVGTTASAEGGMGPHLHFSVSRDGQVIDPGQYIEG